MTVPDCCAEPEVIDAGQRLLVGLHRSMSLADNQTHRLWRDFMSRREEVGARLGEHLLDVKFYAEGVDFLNFNAGSVFEKWAAVEVTAAREVPQGMDGCLIEAGSFAVLPHIGPAERFVETMGYFHRQWLPGSGYELRHAPHFEILQPDYNPMAPDAREQVWVPVSKCG